MSRNRTIQERQRIRPKNATPEVALELRKHMTLQAIANAWGISKTRVWDLVKTAEKRAAKEATSTPIDR